MVSVIFISISMKEWMLSAKDIENFVQKTGSYHHLTLNLKTDLNWLLIFLCCLHKISDAGFTSLLSVHLSDCHILTSARATPVFKETLLLNKSNFNKQELLTVCTCWLVAMYLFFPEMFH